jgi:hypothetical protein
MSHKKNFYPDLTQYKINLLARLDKRSQDGLFIMPVGCNVSKKRAIKHVLKASCPILKSGPGVNP